MSIIWDIESGPVPEADLKALYVEKTYEEFAAECDQRWKEETKLAKYEESKAKAWETFVDKAALSPITGRVLAIGFASDKGAKVVDGGGDEAALLAEFWGMYSKSRGSRPSPRKMFGWNIHGFDLPFILRRSWLHGVAIPRGVRDDNDRYWDSIFVDLMQRFSAGEWKAYHKIDDVARFFGVPEKPKESHFLHSVQREVELCGKNFHLYWHDTPENKAHAIRYLLNDLEMPRLIGLRMGVVI